MTADPTPVPESVFSPGRMRAWAHVRGVSLYALADAVGVTVAHVRACQYGHPVAPTPTGDMLRAWAGLLGCTADDLCSSTPDDPGEYWRGANKAMGPMRREDIEAVADILDRNARRRARHRPGRP